MLRARVAVQPLSVRFALFDALHGRSHDGDRSARPCAAATIGLLLTLAIPALADEATHLTPGPVLTPTLVAPGWVAAHFESWASDRPAYAASCRTDEVASELRYLEALVARDQDLRDTARSQLLYPVLEGNSAAKRHTDVAVETLVPLDNDITAIDRLFVKLAALPPCEGARASQETAKAAAIAATAEPRQQAAPAIPAATATFEVGTAFRVPMPGPPRQAPEAAGVPAPAPAPPQPAAPAAEATAPPAPVPSGPVPQVPAKDKPSAARPDHDVFIVRFDSKLPGLTPTGIRALDAALKAADAGRKVRIAIEGCDSGGVAPNGVDCAELTDRLRRMLVHRGVDRPDDLIAKPR